MKNRFYLFIGVAALACATSPAAASINQETAAFTNITQRSPGVDFAYVDPQLRAQIPVTSHSVAFSDQAAASSNPLYQALSRGLEIYRSTWARLPQMQLPAGPILKLGASGQAVDLLRERLGLAAGGGFDEALAQKLSDYQHVHGLAVSGQLDEATRTSLNLGAEHYIGRIAVNLERAAKLPDAGDLSRYIVIDAGHAEALFYRDGRLADSMRVVVGAPATKTPMIAGMIRSASFHPYWNVPPALTQTLTAKRVLDQGLSYLKNYHYEVLADWTLDAPSVDPATIDWKRVAAGQQEVRVRQLPGPWNSLGEMKFEMSNDFGIYLHDTPHKEVFAEPDRHVSNGCIRLEDYRKFASWIFDAVPQPTSDREQRFAPAVPVPIFVTYLTVDAGPEGVTFRADPYQADTAAIPRIGTGGPIQLASAD